MNAEFAKCTNQVGVAVGGQKSVYSANHPTFGKVVLKEGSFSSASSLERIRREIEAFKAINSIYYPKHYFFEIDLINNKFYIIEEYIEGNTLTKSTALFTDIDSIIKLLSQLINALTIIWEMNIVHRDLKPDNIIIRPDLTPCILDLGIARFLDQDSLTRSFFSMGPCTPIYASPEQLLNQKNNIDKRTDFFALGIIILQIYLGYHPFDPTFIGNSSSIPENILNGHYVKPDVKPEGGADFNIFVNTLLAQQPYRRFRTVEILKNSLNKLI
ncbi:serine/threonine-protein kinase [Spirosoma jeollabukense]